MWSFEFIDRILRRHNTDVARAASRVDYGFFSIDWDCEDGRLREQFSEWLERRREEVGKPLSEPSRGGARDQLRWLGALRIKEHYGRKRLVDQNLKRLKIASPYSNLPDLYTAAKKARAIIEQRVQQISEMDAFR